MLSFVKTLCNSHLHVLCIVVCSVYFYRVSVVICDKCDYDFIFSTSISSVVTVVIIIICIICVIIDFAGLQLKLYYRKL